MGRTSRLSAACQCLLLPHLEFWGPVTSCLSDIIVSNAADMVRITTRRYILMFYQIATYFAGIEVLGEHA